VSETSWKSLAIHHVMNKNRARKYLKSQMREFKAVRHLSISCHHFTL